jgi:hypothetical protein
LDVEALDAEAVLGWTGPTAEPHDFRLGNIELEVKSTRSRQHVHIINGLDQLQASQGLILSLLSLLFEPANTDDAFNLPSLVQDISSGLSPESRLVRTFEKLLRDGYGYRSSDESHYQARYRLRSLPLLMTVDETFPKLTRSELQQVIAPSDSGRIHQVSYSLNVEGLGFLEGTQEFAQIFGSGTP